MEPASLDLLRRGVRLVRGLDCLEARLDEKLAQGVVASDESCISNSDEREFGVLARLSTDEGVPPTDCDLLPFRLALRMRRRKKEPPFLVCSDLA